MPTTSDFFQARSDKAQELLDSHPDWTPKHNKDGLLEGVNAYENARWIGIAIYPGLTDDSYFLVASFSNENYENETHSIKVKDRSYVDSTALTLYQLYLRSERIKELEQQIKRLKKVDPNLPNTQKVKRPTMRKTIEIPNLGDIKY